MKSIGFSPGGVKTDFGRGYGVDEKGYADMLGSGSNNPLRRVGESIDISGHILHLASEDSSWVTGIIMVIDGGSINA